MKKIILTLFVMLFSCLGARADEGMWIPSIIKYTKLNDMQEKGLKLSAEDLYSVNQASLKDAVVRFEGCTAELISDKGLILTNYHCGYDQVQYHSNIDHDYLTNGFAAMSQQEELPSYNASADFLVRMDDVSKAVLKGVTEKMSREQRNKLINKNSDAIVAKTIKGTNYNAKIESLYYNNQYFIFVYESYKDVRLVIAPPSSIGKFGGDTDNWMWPRHVADFTMFRIYANKDNKPAKYSKDNIPLTPKKSLTINTAPLKEGDFTFVYGSPGSTNEYLHSSAVKYIIESGNPNKIALRTTRLDIIDKYQKQDDKVRIQYSAKQANISNSWKRWKGESRGVKKLKAIEKKEALEAKFNEWAKNKPQYENVVADLAKNYKELTDYSLTRSYYYESIQSIEIFNSIRFLLDVNTKNIEAKKDIYDNNKDFFFKDYYEPIDREVAKAMLKAYYEKVPAQFHPKVLTDNIWKLDDFVDQLFDSSIFTSEKEMDKLFDEPSLTIIDLVYNDPIFKVFKEFNTIFKQKVEPKYKSLNLAIQYLYKDYMKGLMTMQKDRTFYPDANRTLRIAYGKIAGFEPSDGVVYNFQTSIEGFMEKENPNIYDYQVDPKMKELYNNKDFGRWAIDGYMPVCFIATNHTTGGNSGSPVLNGNGELIGLNFDRCWESTMSDIIYSDDMCRNIIVNIRFVLFITDKVCGAPYLIDEMNIK
ncbi:MAG: S46 family peptidase [Bacteroidetes bacterium]|nr:S46 family peptidase [Bacteroidota bacterium]